MQKNNVTDSSYIWLYRNFMSTFFMKMSDISISTKCDIFIKKEKINFFALISLDPTNSILLNKLFCHLARH